MKITVLPAAWDDLAEGYFFYESQAKGVGDYFRDALIIEIDSLATTAGIHRRVSGYHRLLAGKFPFAVYYSVEGDLVVVRAVLDCRRDPAWTREKLR